MERRRTDAYKARKASLPSTREFELELIEDSIIADPGRQDHRHERPDGTIVDYSSDGFCVAFEPGDPEPLFVEFVDLTEY